MLPKPGFDDTVQPEPYGARRELTNRDAAKVRMRPGKPLDQDSEADRRGSASREGAPDTGPRVATLLDSPIGLVDALLSKASWEPKIPGSTSEG